MEKINKWSPGELIALGIMGAIICFALGVAILVVGVFNDMFSYWLTSNYWYVKALALLCYLGEICIAVGLLISIRAKVYDWRYERTEKKELVELAKGRV